MRVPAKPLGSYPFYLQPFFWNQRRKYGEVLQAALLWARAPKLFAAVAALYGHCQTNLNGPAKGAGVRRSGRQLTPLGQGGRTVLFEDIAAVEMAVVVEVVWIDAWAAANFCRVLTALNLCIARSRRRNGWWEFSARLLSHRPHS